MLPLILFLLTSAPPNLAPAWTPKDKEMVVLVGSAFIEQEARDGYLETELIRLFPNKDIRVRNLGWSGDTVHCQARGYFGGAKEGFERLRTQLQMIKPTTVICCYGTNESWKGEAGIAEFRKGYEKLIDMIREMTGATLVLVIPPRFEPRGVDYPRLANANNDLLRYTREIKYVADSKTCIFNAFADHLNANAYTEDGVKFSRRGYLEAAGAFWRLASGEPGPFSIVDHRKKVIQPSRANVSDISINEQSIKWTQVDDLLHGIRIGNFDVMILSEDLTCKVDGKETIPNSTNRDALLLTGPAIDQTQHLRQAIIKKNALFFNRWRPANETYLYGFRKHEQGTNALEPPQFDALVEEAEKEIAVLKKPVAHRYELVRMEGKSE